MPKIPDPVPSKSVSVPVAGDALEALNFIVAESRRLKPAWQDTPQSILVSIVEDFLEQPDAFDRFVVLRVDDEQRELLRQIAELKALKQAVRDGTLEEGDETADTPGKPASGPASALKRPEPAATPNPLPHFGPEAQRSDNPGR